MRDSILRVIDDLETKEEEYTEESRSEDYTFYYAGLVKGIEYAINELRKVLDDHAKPNDIQTTSNT